MKKKLMLVFLCFLILNLLSGCSLAGLDSQGLISPPRANADQQGIHALLRGEEGEINFVYPKNGEFRSAVIMRDFTGDSNEDALGFCTDAEGGINLRFMQKEGNTWSTIASVKNPATQVDRVCFGDLNGDKVEEIIVGWGAPQSMTATLSIYRYSGGKIQEFTLDHGYNEFAVTDFDADGIQELFTATTFTKTEEEGGKDKKAVARVFAFEDKPVMLYSCLLNDAVVRYTALSFGGIDSQKNGVVLEGVLGEGSTVSQLLYIENDRLLSPLSSKPLQKKYNFFQRPALVTVAAKDINGDGQLELPKVTLQPNYTPETASGSYAYYVDWVQLDTETMEHWMVERDIYNIPDNYMLVLPTGRDIASYQDTEGELTFKELILDDAGEVLYTQRLFTIKSFTDEEWQDESQRLGFGLLLSTNNNLIYGVKSFRNNELQKNIKLISE